MKAAVEISLYPLDAAFVQTITEFIRKLNSHTDLAVQTNAMSTQVSGPLERIMSVLAHEMQAAAQAGPKLVFVMKVIPGLAIT